MSRKEKGMIKMKNLMKGCQYEIRFIVGGRVKQERMEVLKNHYGTYNFEIVGSFGRFYKLEDYQILEAKIKRKRSWGWL